MTREEMIKECVTPNEEVSKRVRVAYLQGRADAINECEKEIKKHYQYDCEIGGYIRLRELNFEQLKDNK